MKLITTKGYLLLIDEKAEINFNDYWIYNNPNTTFSEVIVRSKMTEQEWFSKLHDRSYYKKVIAYRPRIEEAKELDLPLLSDPFKFKQTIEEIIIRRFKNHANQYGWPSKSFKEKVTNYLKAAQSNKQFSLEDIRKAFRAGRNYENEYNYEYAPDEDEYIQSLSTQQIPKEFVPEYIKTKEVKSFEFDGTEEGELLWKRKLKIVINSDDKPELVGTYK